MIITDSNVALASSHTQIQHHEQRESLTYWKAGREPVRLDSENAGPALKKMVSGVESQAVKVSLSTEALAAQSSVQAGVGVNAEVNEGETLFDLKYSLLRMLVERLTGREIVTCKPCEAAPDTASPASSSGSETVSGTPQNLGWGLSYDYHETFYEAEFTQFSASGQVQTSDGQEIAFEVALNMSREVLETTDIAIRAGDALKDPLVLNFNGTAAQLTQTSFAFDLDLDGSEDRMAFVTPGSGFLALDKNGDDIVNNGAELFGPTTHDGFLELAAYDDDGNGWIDENDGVFSRLRVWEKDASGQDRLSGLIDLGVGAIYLDAASTPFALKDGADNLQGAIRSSGVFLNENGGVGTIQQLDLVV